MTFYCCVQTKKNKFFSNEKKFLKSSFFKKNVYLCTLKNRGVAQLVAYTYGVRVVAGSSPVTPTFLINFFCNTKTYPLILFSVNYIYFLVIFS